MSYNSPGSHCENCDDLLEELETLSERVKSYEEDNATLEADAHNAKECLQELSDKVETLEETVEKYVDAIALAREKIESTLYVLRMAIVPKAIQEALNKPLPERLQLYEAAIEHVVPNYYEPMERWEHTPSFNRGRDQNEIIAQTYGAEYHVICDIFGDIDYEDRAFTEEFLEHVHKAEKEPYLNPHLDAILLTYVLKYHASSQWVNSIPSTEYTMNLLTKYVTLCSPVNSPNGCCYSEEVRSRLSIFLNHPNASVSSGIDLGKAPYALLFRSYCLDENYTSAMDMIRRCRNMDVAFTAPWGHTPEVARFWEWFGESDLRLASLAEKVENHSVLRKAPFYRRFSVLKLKGEMSSSTK